MKPKIFTARFFTEKNSPPPGLQQDGAELGWEPGLHVPVGCSLTLFTLAPLGPTPATRPKG